MNLLNFKHYRISQSENLSSKFGFTLIELLVVISIISLLSSIIMAALNDTRDKARWATFEQELGQLMIAIELYRDDNEGKIPLEIAESDIIPKYIPKKPELPYNKDAAIFYVFSFDPVGGEPYDPRYLYIVDEMNYQDVLDSRYVKLISKGWTYDDYGYYYYYGD